jgi:hypothetical protein
MLLDIYGRITNFRNKLERLLKESLSSQVYCLWAKPGAYPTMEHLKIGSLG